MWRAANSKPAWLPRTVHFVLRGEGSSTEYLESKNGRIRYYRSREAAQKVADSLNRA